VSQVQGALTIIPPPRLATAFLVRRILYPHRGSGLDTLYLTMAKVSWFDGSDIDFLYADPLIRSLIFYEHSVWSTRLLTIALPGPNG
jgi:hypothetical protein